MRFVAIDTETTGLDRDNDQIIEIAIVLVDTKLPRHEWPVYHKMVAHDRYEGGAYAINMNGRIFAQLSLYEKGKNHFPVIHVDNLLSDVVAFLANNGFKTNPKHGKYTIYVAGKNPHGFDIPMMLNRHHRFGDYINFGHRGLDPAILFLDLEKDEIPPGLEVCKERAGLGNIVTHNALEDTMDVIDLILIGKGLDPFPGN